VKQWYAMMSEFKNDSKLILLGNCENCSVVLID